MKKVLELKIKSIDFPVYPYRYIMRVKWGNEVDGWTREVDFGTDDMCRAITRIDNNYVDYTDEYEGRMFVWRGESSYLSEKSEPPAFVLFPILRFIKLANVFEEYLEHEGKKRKLIEDMIVAVEREGRLNEIEVRFMD